jgi:hypothetical protein
LSGVLAQIGEEGEEGGGHVDRDAHAGILGWESRGLARRARGLLGGVALR